MRTDLEARQLGYLASGFHQFRNCHCRGIPVEGPPFKSGIIPKKKGSRSMKTLTETVVIEAPAPKVFAFMDDVNNVGFHMSGRSSMAMMGSRLKIEVLSSEPTGVGATYRMWGKMMGQAIDFSETVTKYAPGREKIWGTIGEPKMLIMSSYVMRVTVDPLTASSSRLTISLTYAPPRSILWRSISALVGDRYGQWCLRNMCQDAKDAVAVLAPRVVGHGSAALT